jgi:hypothetical protein
LRDLGGILSDELAPGVDKNGCFRRGYFLYALAFAIIEVFADWEYVTNVTLN